MIDFSKRSECKEIIDRPGIPAEDIYRNMQELRFINKWLGGHENNVSAFTKLLGDNSTVSVCEIGSGGGDNLDAIANYCQRKQLAATISGIDANQFCISFAVKNNSWKNVEFIESDYSDVSFKKKPDIIFTSLFCHHFSNQEIRLMLEWMNANCELGFFINDLHRHPIAYHFIKIASSFFSKSYMVKNDAPVSVLRGFKKNEWIDIFQSAGITNFTITWKWPFRYLIVCKKNLNISH